MTVVTGWGSWGSETLSARRRAGNHFFWTGFRNILELFPPIFRMMLKGLWVMMTAQKSWSWSQQSDHSDQKLLLPDGGDEPTSSFPPSSSHQWCCRCSSSPCEAAWNHQSVSPPRQSDNFNYLPELSGLWWPSFVRTPQLDNGTPLPRDHR